MEQDILCEVNTWRAAYGTKVPTVTNNTGTGASAGGNASKCRWGVCLFALQDTVAVCLFALQDTVAGASSPSLPKPVHARSCPLALYRFLPLTFASSVFALSLRLSFYTSTSTPLALKCGVKLIRVKLILSTDVVLTFVTTPRDDAPNALAHTTHSIYREHILSI